MGKSLFSVLSSSTVLSYVTFTLACESPTFIQAIHFAMLALANRTAIRPGSRKLRQTL